MALLDPARRRVLLDTLELEAAVFLAAGTGQSTPAALQPGVHRLEEAGAVRDGRMVEPLAEMARTMAAPALEVVVETQVVGPPLFTVVYGIPGQCVLVAAADGDGDRWALTPLEPGNLPFALSAVIGFGSRPAPRTQRPVDVSLAALDAAVSAAAPDAVERAAVAEALAEIGDAEAREAVAALIRSRRLSWRVTVAWNAGDGSTRRGTLAVVDGGEAGMWETAPVDPSRPQTGVRLTPRTSTELWQRLLALVPPPRSPAPRS